MRAASPRPRVVVFGLCLVAELLRLFVFWHDEFLGVQTVWTAVDLLLLVRVWPGGQVARFALVGLDVVVAALTAVCLLTMGRPGVDGTFLVAGALALGQAALLVSGPLRQPSAVPAARTAGI